MAHHTHKTLTTEDTITILFEILETQMLILTNARDTVSQLTQVIERLAAEQRENREDIRAMRTALRVLGGEQ